MQATCPASRTSSIVKFGYDSAMADQLIHKILGLLSSEAHERQIAAAIVLGEIGARGEAVTAALAATVAGGIPPVQRHALEALARLASGKAARKALPAGSTMAPAVSSTVSGRWCNADAGTSSCSAKAPGQPRRMPISYRSTHTCWRPSRQR